MAEQIKKKINLSGLNIGGQEKLKTEDVKELEILNVPEIIEEEKDIKAKEDSTLQIKSSKISLAGMKQKRETPKGNPNLTEEGNEKEEEKEANLDQKENSKKQNITLSLDEKKVEIILDEEKSKNKGKDNKENNSESSESNEEETSTEKNGEEEEKRISLFSNYTSDFEKEEGTILEKLKDLGKKPQTRVLLVVILIISTILGIATLFIIDPKRHSVSHYKAVLMSSYNKYTGKNTFVQKNNNVKIKQENKQKWKDDSLIRNGYKISIQTKIDLSGVRIYKFNNTEFNTISKLNTEIDIEIKKLKSGKVKDFLLKARQKKQENNLKAKTDTSSSPTKIQKKSNLDLLRNR